MVFLCRVLKTSPDDEPIRRTLLPRIGEIGGPMFSHSGIYWITAETRAWSIEKTLQTLGCFDISVADLCG